MRFKNPANAETPYYVGKCKNNTPPKHVLDDKAEHKTLKVGDTSFDMIKSAKSDEYIYLKGKDNEGADEWMWVKDSTLFGHTSLELIVPEKKEPKPKKEKVEKTKDDGKAPVDNSIDLEGTYNVFGTEMLGKDAKKKFGAKNIKDGIESGKVVLTKPSAPAEAAEATTAPAEEAAVAAGDTGAA